MKSSEIVNGYKIPGDKGGFAVRVACHLIVQNPGIRQTALFDIIATAANLNASTAGWLTSPAPGNPSNFLWQRRKNEKGHFCLFPNEFTNQVVSFTETIDARINEIIQHLEMRHLDKVGTIVSNSQQGCNACMIVGYRVSSFSIDDSRHKRTEITDLSYLRQMQKSDMSLHIDVYPIISTGTTFLTLHESHLHEIQTQ